MHRLSAWVTEETEMMAWVMPIARVLLMAWVVVAKRRRLDRRLGAARVVRVAWPSRMVAKLVVVVERTLVKRDPSCERFLARALLLPV